MLSLNEMLISLPRIRFHLLQWKPEYKGKKDLGTVYFIPKMQRLDSEGLES